MIALKVEIAFFGIYGYTAIIPYMLVRTRSNIKKRRLATIGISHQSYINSTTFAQSDTFQFFFTQTHILAHPLVIIKMYRIPEHFLFANNLNHFSFLMPQWYFISHYLVLNRILQRGIQQYLHRFSLDKSHFYDSLTETTMSQYFNNYTFFTGFQFGQTHSLLSFFIFAAKIKDKFIQRK